VSGLRKTLQWGVPAIVSVGVLALLLGRDDIDLLGVFASIRPSVAQTLVPAFLTYVTVSLLIEAFCLVRMADVPSETFSYSTAARVKAASYLAYTLHYTLGVSALTVLLRRRAGLVLGDAAGVVLLIAFYDLGVALSLVTFGGLLLGADTPGLRAGVIAVAVVGILGGFTILRAPIDLGPLERLREMSVFRAVRTAPLASLFELGVMRVVFAMTFVSLIGVALYSFGITVPLPELIVSTLFVALVSALPIAVAGIGTGNAAFVYAFRQYADPQTLLACSLAVAAGMIAFRAGMGLLFAREYAREAIDAVRRGEAEDE
jgi:hypothetical protein